MADFGRTVLPFRPTTPINSHVFGVPLTASLGASIERGLGHKRDNFLRPGTAYVTRILLGAARVIGFRVKFLLCRRRIVLYCHEEALLAGR